MHVKFVENVMLMQDLFIGLFLHAPRAKTYFSNYFKVHIYLVLFQLITTIPFDISSNNSDTKKYEVISYRDFGNLKKSKLLKVQFKLKSKICCQMTLCCENEPNELLCQSFPQVISGVSHPSCPLN